MTTATPRVLCEWGLAGVGTMGAAGVAALVVVDVLSFSTAVDVATARGASVAPFAEGDEATAGVEAERLGAVLARSRRAAAAEGDGYSLSPASLARAPPGLRLLLPSPNGGRLSAAAAALGVPVFAGCLRNAAAVARAARGLAAGNGAVGVVPAGERWPGGGGLRPAVEDHLGAGAVVEHLGLPPSPEARVARDAFRAAATAGDLADLLRESVSGRELRGRGFGEDVEIAARVGESTTAPRLLDGAYRAT